MWIINIRTQLSSSSSSSSTRTGGLPQRLRIESTCGSVDPRQGTCAIGYQQPCNAAHMFCLCSAITVFAHPRITLRAQRPLTQP